jgi:hypothetical protein
MKKSYMIGCIVLLSSLALNAQTEDPQTTQKLQKMLAAKYARIAKESRKFVYDKVDLNDDGKDEVLVGLVGSEFCGSGGCSMLVLGPDMKTLTSMTVVGFPVSIGPPGSKEVTKGYCDLYVYSKGKGYVRLAWNGKTYPTNPSLAPVVNESVVKEKYKFLDNAKTQYEF